MTTDNETPAVQMPDELLFDKTEEGHAGWLGYYGLQDGVLDTPVPIHFVFKNDIEREYAEELAKEVCRRWNTRADPALTQPEKPIGPKEALSALHWIITAGEFSEADTAALSDAVQTVEYGIKRLSTPAPKEVTGEEQRKTALDVFNEFVEAFELYTYPEKVETVRAALTQPATPDYAEVYVGRGHYAICDWADWPLVRGYKWHLTTDKAHVLYAQAWSSEDSTVRKRIAMHRLILSGADTVDHINGNGLDNRRCNLRSVTKQQNAFNARSTRGTSQYKGVCLEKSSGLWRVYIRKDDKRYYLGRYGSEIDAAKAYDKAAKELYGEYAKCNF